jgi:hypothetical protein
MPNGTVHRAGAALTIGGISAYLEQQKGKNTLTPWMHAILAACFGTLPDVFEPAFHPNHRQFFHSLTFAVLLGSGLYRLQRWEVDDEVWKFLKSLGLVAGGAYLVHLIMDSTTAKSLPII